MASSPVVPTSIEVVDAARRVTQAWARFFGSLAGSLVETDYSVGILAAGASAAAVTVPFPGARPGDLATAALDPGADDLFVAANARADAVRVIITNRGSGASSAGTGTLRVRVEGRA